MCADSELEAWTSREQSLLLRWAGPSCAQGEAHLREIAEAGLPLPAANQLELHPLCQKRALLALPSPTSQSNCAIIRQKK